MDVLLKDVDVVVDVDVDVDVVVDVDVDVDACGGQWTLGVLNVILSVGNQTTLLQQYPNLKAITEASKQFHFLVRIHK